MCFENSRLSSMTDLFVFIAAHGIFRESSAVFLDTKGTKEVTILSILLGQSPTFTSVEHHRENLISDSDLWGFKHIMAFSKAFIVTLPMYLSANVLFLTPGFFTVASWPSEVEAIHH